jgi:hypothetical protein
VLTKKTCNRFSPHGIEMACYMILPSTLARELIRQRLRVLSFPEMQAVKSTPKQATDSNGQNRLINAHMAAGDQPPFVVVSLLDQFGILTMKLRMRSSPQREIWPDDAFP